ncbi:clotting factor G beta subunit-like [Topomyia yanbarensis]|uniref:clotting factor G beta subunit-like n=1 Tax=Topomyia yanbarensis TaxID=2498891 RepID=UPI00273A9918|nr:clotting factor G beta subunit-like [Topomyia yanbarensis]
MKCKIFLAFVTISFCSHARCFQSCGERQVKTRNLITNSFDVQPGDYPWHAAIFQRFPIKQYICGGTLVGQSVIITSAHCVSVPGRRQAKPIDDFVVQVGKHLLNAPASDSEREYSLSSVIVHQASSAEQSDHDIALLITEKPVQYGKYVQPACLPTFSLVRDNLVGTIVGWDYTENNTVSDVLKAANVPIVTKDVCIRSNLEAFARSVTDEMFCAGYRNGTNACNGDSGGGLFRNVQGRWYLLGIISFTAAKKQNENLCSSTDYTAFVNVAKYREWIKENSDSNFGLLCSANSAFQLKPKKQYYVNNNREVTFLEAWRLCQSIGQQLATITSEEDSQLIEQAIAKSSNTKGPWFIGGTDLGNEGHFVWISTNKPVGYQTGYLNYSPGQPDNAGGNENCLEIGRWGGVVWNDVPCEWKQRYICEYVSWN